MKKSHFNTWKSGGSIPVWMGWVQNYEIRAFMVSIGLGTNAHIRKPALEIRLFHESFNPYLPLGLMDMTGEMILERDDIGVDWKEEMGDGGWDKIRGELQDFVMMIQMLSE